MRGLLLVRLLGSDILGQFPNWCSMVPHVRPHLANVG